ncbi:MAG: TolC family protein [Flavobacteriaceae bacterium]|nr:TolC family protein [Flavobacteriaceae bacterium]
MNKNIVVTLLGCFLLVNSYAQNNEIDQLLKEIEQNNSKLKAFKLHVESRQFENKSENNLPDPQFSSYYLPYGSNNTVEYTEFQISQSIEFPSVYAARGKWNDLRKIQLDNDYAKVRQEVLLSAKNYGIELVLLQEKKILEVVRRDQSEKIYQQLLQLFNKEQIGILDLNKAKIAWVQKQFVVDQMESNIQMIVASLEKLNGNKPIVLKTTLLEDHILTDDLEKIWSVKLETDPWLKGLKVNEEASLQKVQLEKNKVWPNLTAGYNYQGISNDNYAGFFGGISIPLWNSNNKVKAAKADYQFQQTNTVDETTQLYLKFQQQFYRYQLLLKKYEEYRITLDALNSEALLYKAYNLGELSFINYYQELLFYRDAYDNMLQMKKELHLLKAELLKHQL